VQLKLVTSQSGLNKLASPRWKQGYDHEQQRPARPLVMGWSGSSVFDVSCQNPLRNRAKMPTMSVFDVLPPAGWQPTPFSEFVLKIHSRCDLSCQYCYVYEMSDQSWRSQPRSISRENIEHLARRIAEHVEIHSLDMIQVVLHGGEPLLAGAKLIDYTVSTIRSATNAQVGFVMQTNGVLLDAEYLKLFDELDIHVGISLDGDAGAHDRHRRRANGEGTYAAVARSLELLSSDPFRHLFNGLLCTIDPRNDPIGTYEALLRFQPPTIDFLLPHGNWSSPPPGRIPGSRETPYGDWLVSVFDHWYRAPRQEIRIRLFSEIIKLLLGGASTTELVGLSPVGVVVVETDGSIEQSDILKSAYPGASATGLHISRDSFDSAIALPSFAARQIGIHALGDECCACEIRQTCGGGLYAHRYREDSGFANPSVYCPDLFLLISHIRRNVKSGIAGIMEEKS
jgi:uncharacterized protein